MGPASRHGAPSPCLTGAQRGPASSSAARPTPPLTDSSAYDVARSAVRSADCLSLPKVLQSPVS